MSKSKIKNFICKILLAVFTIAIIIGDVYGYVALTKYQEVFTVVDKWTSQYRGTISNEIELHNNQTNHTIVQEVRKLEDYNIGETYTQEVSDFRFFSALEIICVACSLVVSIMFCLISLGVVFEWLGKDNE